MQLVSLILIHWIVIYPVDSAIQLLNNWGQMDETRKADAISKSFVKLFSAACAGLL